MIMADVTIRRMQLNHSKDEHVPNLWWGYGTMITSQGLLFTACAFIRRFIAMHHGDYDMIWAVLAALCVAADMLLFRMVNEQLRRIRAAVQNDGLRTLQQMQIAHNLELEQRLGQISRIQCAKTEQLGQLRALFAQDDKQAIAYVNQCIADQRCTAPIFYCAHPVINAVFYSKAHLAAQRGIEFDLYLAVPNALPIDDIDVVGVLTNLLDNAIEGCSGVSIAFSADVRIGHIFIRCSNPCAHSVPFSNGLPVSTKHPGRGFGTKSICAIAKKYDGIATFSLKDGQFVTTVCLRLPETEGMK